MKNLNVDVPINHKTTRYRFSGGLIAPGTKKKVEKKSPPPNIFTDALCLVDCYHPIEFFISSSATIK
jgi:hypothetical protein